MATDTQTYVTPDEYLAREREAEQKHEYVDGEVRPMSGASFQHVLIVTNIVRELSTRLRESDCLVASTDLRVRVRPDGLFTYPDVVVVCEAPQFADEHHDTLLNPTLIVEVLSASTRDYDRGEGRRSCPRYKFARYRTLDTLQEYVLVDQATTHVEHFVRQPEGGWLLSETDARADAISLAAIDCELPLSEMYHKAEAASRDE